MTTKFLTSNHPDAYGLKSNYSELVIDLGVSVGTVDSKYGVASSHTATIVNYGTVGSVGSYYGVYLREGGRVTNGSATDTKAVISGGYTQGAAVDAKGASATLTNFGTILGTENNNSLGVNLYDGGTVSNGSAADTTALISAALGIYSRASVVTTVVNFGTIYGGGGAAVDFQDAADRLVVESKAAFMGGVSGGGGTLELAAGSDTITGLGAQGVMTGSTAASFDEFGAYIVDAGARLTLTGTNALTTGKSLSVAGSLINTGSLQAASRYDNGVDLSPGGRVTNGSATDSTASISGYFGVSATGSAGSAGVTVTNFGTIFGTSRYSVDFVSASDRLIVEAGSVLVGEVLGDGGTLELAGGSETITGLGSYGAMTGGASGDLYGFGAYLVDAGAQLTLTGTNALATGQSLSVAGALVNTGTLRGPSASGYGVTLTGGRLTNGSATDAAALTIGYIGVYAAGSAPATVTNFGTIEGTGGVALDFHAAGDRLIVEETAAFVGALAGGGGTLELVGGSDTITGLGGAGKLTGSVLASFSGFATYVVDTGAQLTLTGNNLLTTHQSAVSVAGSLVNTGTLSAPAGGYGLTLTGGRLTNGSAADTTALILSTYGNGGADYAVRTSGAGSTISNFGTIRGQAGVYMDGGTLTNGSVADTAALISSTLDQGVGDFGVRTYGTGVATITNFGTIHGEMGVYIDGGTLTNGSAADTTALISSTLEYGVATYGTVATTITNFGTISSASAPAVRLGLAADRLIVESKAVFVGALEGGGGTLELAGGSDTISGLGGAGVITGSTSTSFSGFGAYVVDAGADLTLTGTNALATGQSLESAGALVNTGTLAGPAASGYGVTLLGGSLTNGSAADTTALITGDRSGVYAVVGTTVTVTNFGMIQALGAGNTVGVNLWANGKVANGSAADTIALIKGGIGVYSYGPAVTTVTNFGTIDGTGGTAVDFHDGADRLVVESKAVFVGALVGGGGTLELAGGSDTITGLGGSGTMTGATSASFSGFATYQLNVGVSCTLTGANALSSTQKVIDSGAVVVSGTLSGAGIVGGTGTASVTAAGTIDASAATALTLDPKSVANGGLLEGTGAGGLTLSATTVANTGVIEAAMGSRVTLRGADIRGGTLLTAGTGKIDTSSGDECAGWDRFERHQQRHDRCSQRHGPDDRGRDRRGRADRSVRLHRQGDPDGRRGGCHAYGRRHGGSWEQRGQRDHRGERNGRPHQCRRHPPGRRRLGRRPDDADQ
jgi:hypothetical protein